jgi:hypothetical protein
MKRRLKMKNYETPSIELISFDKADVVTTSGETAFTFSQWADFGGEN